MNNVVQLNARKPAPSLWCSSCDAEVTAGCQCGVDYVNAGDRAKIGLAKHPEKSNRALAAEFGVDEGTIRGARKAGAENSAPEKRLGKDGKQYPVPKKPAAAPVTLAGPIEAHRGTKEHKITAKYAIEKLLRDTEPTFRFGFWPLVTDGVNAISPEQAAVLATRAAACRAEFQRLFKLLTSRSEIS